MKPKVSVITPALVKNEEQLGWMRECIQSVVSQTYNDWEMVIINDGSPVSLIELETEFPDDRIVWYKSDGLGAAMARNSAAHYATADLLLPLDADDKLAPNAIQRFMETWNSRKAGDGDIIYSDALLFGQDFQREYKAPEYDLSKLMHGTYMIVGSLHRKSAWRRAGGWRGDMEGGLEDWEYWVHLGEMGLCGIHLPETLYWYRKNPDGRIEKLKRNQKLYTKAYQKLRSLHPDLFSGNWPPGACASKGPTRTRPQARPQVAPTKGGTVLLQYRGIRGGSFKVRGRPSGQLYRVPGRGGKFRVAAQDVAHFKLFGKDYVVISVSSVNQSPPRERPLRSVTERNPKARPVTSIQTLQIGGEPKSDAILPDVNELSVRAIRELTLDPIEASFMLDNERRGKNRKTVITWLERQANA